MDISKALLSLAPGASWSMNDDDYNQITWNSPDIPKPTEQEVVQKIAELTYQQEVEVYKEQRAAEYPSMADQQDMQFHDAVNGTTTWKDAIQAVKDKYPKQTMDADELQRRKDRALAEM